MLLKISNFSGIAPQADPHLLASNQAQVAINCRFMGGVLNSYKALRSVTADPIPGRSKSIYRFGQAETDEAKFWFTFSVDTDVAGQSDEYIKSDFASQSCQSNEYAGACHRNRSTVCSGNDHCYANGCGHQTDTGSGEGHVDTECNDCRCYNCDCGNEDGTAASTPSAERERTSTGIWIGNELGAYQRADQISAAGIEYITGIPTGVAV